MYALYCGTLTKKKSSYALYIKTEVVVFCIDSVLRSCLDAMQAAILTWYEKIERLGALACAWHASQYSIQTRPKSMK